MEIPTVSNQRIGGDLSLERAPQQTADRRRVRFAVPEASTLEFHASEAISPRESRSDVPESQNAEPSSYLTAFFECIASIFTAIYHCIVPPEEHRLEPQEIVPPEEHRLESQEIVPPEEEEDGIGWDELGVRLQEVEERKKQRAFEEQYDSLPQNFKDAAWGDSLDFVQN